MNVRICASWILAALLLISVCLPAGKAQAEQQTGSIALQLPENPGNAELSLYKVAVYEDGVFSLTSDFAASGAGITAAGLNNTQEVEALAEKLTAFARDNRLPGSTSAKPDGNGLVRFTGLSPALYMVVQSAGEADIRIQAALVPIPYLEEGGVPAYDAAVVPKYEHPGGEQTYSITVKKSLTDLEDTAVFAKDSVFYVALFSDAGHTQRVSQVLPVYFRGENSGQVTFENLTGGTTYYVGETDESGTYLEGGQAGTDGDTYYIPVYPDTTRVTVGGQTKETVYSFKNVFNKITSGFYYSAEITVTKKVQKDGEEYNTNAVYYCALFQDKECTKREGDIIRLDMDGGCETSVTVPVEIGDSADKTLTYYVRETDQNGVPLENTANLGFTVKQDKEKVEVSYQKSEDEVVITNIYGGSPPPAPEPTGTPAPEGSSTPSSGPRTGDDTDIAPYVILLLISAAVGATVIAGKKKRKV